MNDEERNTSLINAMKHYRALFSLPSSNCMLALLMFGVPVFCSILYGVRFSSVEKMIDGFLFGLFTLALPSLVLDYSFNNILGSRDPILTKRRLFGVSFFQIAFWFLPPLFFVLVSPLSSPPLPFRYSFSVGFGFGVALRLTTFYSVSTIGILRVALVSTVQPVFSMLLMFVAWRIWDPNLLAVTLLSGILGYIGSFAFLVSLDDLGIERIGMPTFRLFRAFIANWTEGVREPLESYLEDISDKKDLSIVLSAFRSSGKTKAVLVVPNFHPGPFKNVGSSHLPLLLEKHIAQETEALVSVMHGTSGHEHDLPSQAENEKFISFAMQLVNFTDFSPFASIINRFQVNRGKASCQRLGAGILVTLTRSPESTEDLPPEVGIESTMASKHLGIDHVAVVDSHNSIDDDWILPQNEVEDLVKASRAVILDTSDTTLSHFEVGVSKICPETYSLEQGIGPSGISVLAIKTQGLLFCYITVDGNNMVSGLREKILDRVCSMGISDGEVVTTDTHMVNAISLSDRGYHPVGEAINQELFIDQICEAVGLALEDLEPADVAWNSGIAKGMKVFGMRSLRRQLDFVHEATNYAKIVATVSYGSCLLILLVLLSRLIV